MKFRNLPPDQRQENKGVKQQPLPNNSVRTILTLLLFSFILIWYPRSPDNDRNRRDALIDRILNGGPLSPGQWRTWYQELWRLPAECKPELWRVLEAKLDNKTVSDIRRGYILVAREEVDAMLKWRIYKAGERP